ncbi:MAG: hypothetical protein R3B68_09845 [Phycisphaerales bacterium]
MTRSMMIAALAGTACVAGLAVAQPAERFSAAGPDAIAPPPLQQRDVAISVDSGPVSPQGEPARTASFTRPSSRCPSPRGCA